MRGGHKGLRVHKSGVHSVMDTFQVDFMKSRAKEEYPSPSTVLERAQQLRALETELPPLVHQPVTATAVHSARATAASAGINTAASTAISTRN